MAWVSRDRGEKNLDEVDDLPRASAHREGCCWDLTHSCLAPSPGLVRAATAPPGAEVRKERAPPSPHCTGVGELGTGKPGGLPWEELPPNLLPPSPGCWRLGDVITGPQIPRAGRGGAVCRMSGALCQAWLRGALSTGVLHELSWLSVLGSVKNRQPHLMLPAQTDFLDRSPLPRG